VHEFIDKTHFVKNTKIPLHSTSEHPQSLQPAEISPCMADNAIGVNG